MPTVGPALTRLASLCCFYSNELYISLFVLEPFSDAELSFVLEGPNVFYWQALGFVDALFANFRFLLSFFCSRFNAGVLLERGCAGREGDVDVRAVAYLEPSNDGPFP